MTLLKGDKIILRNIEEHDLPILWQEKFGVENPEWKKWDAPYFPLKHIDYPAFKTEWEKLKEVRPESQMAIIVNGIVIGTVSYYWEHEASRWLEAGITIFQPEYWSGGYGTEALTLWVSHLFRQLPLARVGITTWSGNKRMMRAAEKIGMQLEGRMRKCRYYNGEYYDSIRMGVLREEWELLHPNKE